MEKISHPGIIDHLDQNKAFVRIISQSACSSCHSKGLCSVADHQEKLVEVRLNADAAFQEGERINVVMKPSIGNKAVLLGYLIPFILLITCLLVSSSFLSEGIAGLLSIAVLLPYYLLLYFFKNRLSNTFSFHIEPLQRSQII